MAVPNDPAQALLLRNVTFNPPQGGGSQVSTGPAVPVNSNPIGGALAGAASAPGAVGPAALAAPQSPGTTYTAVVDINVSGVNNPAVLRPASDYAQVDLGNSVINRAPLQGTPSETGLVTAKQG